MEVAQKQRTGLDVYVALQNTGDNPGPLRYRVQRRRVTPQRRRESGLVSGLFLSWRRDLQSTLL